MYAGLPADTHLMWQKYTAHADSEMKQSEIELCMAKATEMQKKYTAHAGSEMKQSKIELCMA